MCTTEAASKTSEEIAQQFEQEARLSLDNVPTFGREVGFRTHKNFTKKAFIFEANGTPNLAKVAFSRLFGFQSKNA